VNPIIFTSINEWNRKSEFAVLCPDHVVAVESHDADLPYRAMLTLVGGTQVYVTQTSDQVLEMILLARED
jgi:hypothetical protein